MLLGALLVSCTQPAPASDWHSTYTSVAGHVVGVALDGAPGDSLELVGTGFVVRRNTLVSAGHVIGSKDQCWLSINGSNRVGRVIHRDPARSPNVGSAARAT